MKHVMLKYIFMKDVVEKKQTTLAYASTNSNRADLMTKWHTFEVHTQGCAMLGLKLGRDDGKTRLKQSQRRKIWTEKCPDVKGECAESRTFSVRISRFRVNSRLVKF